MSGGCLVTMAWRIVKFSLVDNKREHNPPTQIHMHIKKTYIFNNRRQQFPQKKIFLTPDDDHIGRNL
jgi:hypothetical protein